MKTIILALIALTSIPAFADGVSVKTEKGRALQAAAMDYLVRGLVGEVADLRNGEKSLRNSTIQVRFQCGWAKSALENLGQLDPREVAQYDNLTNAIKYLQSMNCPESDNEIANMRPKSVREANELGFHFSDAALVLGFHLRESTEKKPVRNDSGGGSTPSSASGL